jgi:hypothetical protein
VFYSARVKGYVLKGVGLVIQKDYPRFLQDVNADGYFEDRTTWGQRSFCHIAGWTSQNLYPRTVSDVNGDGMGDLVGFGATALWVSPVVD